MIEPYKEELTSLAAVDLFSKLGMSKQDLGDPQKFGKFQELVKFFEGKNDPGFWISKVTQGKNVDKLDQVWEYSQLHTRRAESNKHMEELAEQLEELEMKDGLTTDELELKFTLMDESSHLENGLQYLNEEIGFYEN